MSDDASGQYPPQQPYVPPVSQPPKKKRGWLIALVIGLVVLCGLVSCGSFLVYSSISSQNKKTATIALAETHYAAAESALSTAAADLNELDGAGAGPSSIIMVKAQKSLRVTRDEIAASRAAIEPLEASQGKTDYLASLAAATMGVDALEDLVAYAGTVGDLVVKAEAGGKAASKAADDLNAAIDAGNSSSYGTMKAKAIVASAGFARAATFFRDAHSLDKSAGLDKAAAFADKRKAQSDVVIKMADAGRTGRTSTYNSEIKTMNALGKQATAIGTPAIVKDPDWAKKRTAALQKQIDEAAKKTDALHAKALKELGYPK